MKKLIIAALSLFSIAASAQITENVLITDRPDQTESPNAVGKGIIQIESGVLFERYRLNSTLSAHRTVYPTNLFRIGLLKRLELRVVNEVVSYKTVDNVKREKLNSISGTENLQIGFKYQLTKDDSKLMIGAMAHAIVPTGSEGISNERYGVLSRINFSYDIGENKNLSANVGYNNFDLDFKNEGLVRYAEGNFTYTLVYGVRLSERVGLYLETFGDVVEFENWQSNMDAGMTYLISDQIQVDYSYGWGMNRVMNYHSVGISVRLPK